MRALGTECAIGVDFSGAGKQAGVTVQHQKEHEDEELFEKIMENLAKMVVQEEESDFASQTSRTPQLQACPISCIAKRLPSTVRSKTRIQAPSILLRNPD